MQLTPPSPSPCRPIHAFSSEFEPDFSSTLPSPLSTLQRSQDLLHFHFSEFIKCHALQEGAGACELTCIPNHFISYASAHTPSPALAQTFSNDYCYKPCERGSTKCLNKIIYISWAGLHQTIIGGKNYHLTLSFYSSNIFRKSFDMFWNTTGWLMSNVFVLRLLLIMNYNLKLTPIFGLGRLYISHWEPLCSVRNVTKWLIFGQSRRTS